MTTELTPDQVREIRSSLESSRQLAARFGVTSRHIRRIRQKERRADVPQAKPEAQT